MSSNSNSDLDISEPVRDPLIRQKFVEILKQNGVKDEVEDIIMIHPQVLKGNHMATETVYLKVTFQDASKPPMNLFLKKFSSTNPAHTVVMKASRVMEKETMFYMKFLPRAKEFCKKHKGAETFMDFFPKCIYGDEEMVVEDNVVLNDGWVMLDKFERMDIHTAKLVLDHLAKYHAASYSFIQEECGGIAKFEEEWALIAKEAFLSDDNAVGIRIFQTTIATCLKLLNVHKVPGFEDAMKYLSPLHQEGVKDLLYGILKRKPKDTFLLLNHGDCWSNNLLFQIDKDTGKVKDQIFVDLQTTRVGSPTLDVSYFLYTSVKHELRQAHLTELLQHYYQRLESALALFGGRKCPWTFQDFLEDYRDKHEFGFMFALNQFTTLKGIMEFDMTRPRETPQQMMVEFTQHMEEWVDNNEEVARDITIEIVNVVKECVGINNGGGKFA